MADDIDLNIDETVDSFINEVAPGSTPAPADEPAPAPATPAAAPATTSLAKPVAPGTPAPAPVDVPYPKSWMKDHEALWPQVPEPLRKYITDTREKDYLNGLEQYKAGHTAYSEINQIVSPYMPRLTALNLRPAQAIQALLNADHRLANGSAAERYAALAEICSTYGLDPSQIQAASAGPEMTPGEKALAARLAEQDKTLKNFLGQQVASQRQQIDKDVAAFAADPAHPYLEECGADIALLIKSDSKLSLQDAYDKAVWANPTTRAKEMERVSKEKADLDRKAREEAARKANGARLANLRGKPSERGTGAAKGGWEENLVPTAAAIAARPK